LLSARLSQAAQKNKPCPVVVAQVAAPVSATVQNETSRGDEEASGSGIAASSTPVEKTVPSTSIASEWGDALDSDSGGSSVGSEEEDDTEKDPDY
jgi:hypothetical protein